MICYEQLQSSALQLRCLREEDITERYVAWLNDPEITQYLEVRFHQHTLDSTREFVHSVNASRDTILFGMFVNGGRWHIGNIKLGPVNPHHRRADIGLMIGDRSEWGKGFATLAISLVTAYGFGSLRLSKITAGCYSNNCASLKAFEKVGYEVEARLPKHWQTADGPQDEFLLGITAERHAELSRKRASRRFGFVRKLVLIGGGDLMVETVTEALAQNYEVKVIMAPRHAEEILTLTSLNAREACVATGAKVAVIENINTPGAIRNFAGPDVLALCFGPAWIFSSAVIAAFGAGMINFNGIPIPHYLGGAHYTWQILNGNRQGGCFLQDITAKIDRGDILRAEKFDLPDDVATPHEYFAANHVIGLQFMRQALADFRADREFMPTPFGQLNSRRLFFPRLLTKYNAWINWKWSGREIMLFCQAFDDPYMGAATYLHGEEVRLKKVTLKSDEAGVNVFHSFVAGLIVRKLGGAIWIAAPDGLLQAEFVANAAGLNLLSRLKEGDRFATPPDVLHRARTYVAVITAK